MCKEEITFEEYLEIIRKQVETPPKTKKEAGFQLAVFMIYEQYTFSKK